MTQATLFDLGVEDVHVPAASGNGGKRRKTMSAISTAKRKALPANAFADPENKAYPIHDAAHCRNAAARLEQQKGSLDPAKYRQIRGRIARAAKRLGVDSEYNKKRKRMRHVGGFRLSIDHPKGGRIEVRHMTAAESVRCPTVDLAALADKPEQAVWNQIAKQGRFFKDGAFFSLDAKVFADILRNFESTSNRRVPVDFEHATEAAASAGSIPLIGAPAQGWITRLELRGQELYGLIEWNELARQYIKDGSYKFLSPAVRFGSRDRVTGQDIGARLSSAALTNVPFLDGMQPLAAKDDSAMTEQATQVSPIRDSQSMPLLTVEEATEAVLKSSGTMCYSAAEYMPRLRACLGLSDIATAKMCSDHVGMLREHYAACKGDLSKTPTGVRLGDYFMAMRNMVQPPMGATWDEVLDMVEDLIDAAMDEHVIEYHPEAAEAASDTEDQANMSDTNKTQELSVQLKDAQTEVQRLSFALKEADVQLKASSTRIADLEGTVTAMKAESVKREEKAFEDEVDAVILAYKDAKGVKPEDKPELVAFLKSAPALFRKQFPAVPPAQAHLMRDIAGGVRAPGPRAANETVAAVAEPIPTMAALTLKFQKEGASIEDATSKAYVEMKKLTQRTAH
jgi:phage I-like protein